VANFWTFDNLNSVREVTTSSGTILDQRIYDPYGSTMQLQGTTQATYQYAQLYKHKVSGLNLSLTRPYASNLGRFICRDYLKNIDQLEPNRYIYVSNQPQNWVDPFEEQQHGANGGAPGLPQGGRYPQQNPGNPTCNLNNYYHKTSVGCAGGVTDYNWGDTSYPIGNQKIDVIPGYPGLHAPPAGAL
jgi:RHS repeat-associated protein